MPNFAAVCASLTLDPGYRYLGAKFDDVAGGCSCTGRIPLPASELAALRTQLRGGSLDPACAVLSNQLLLNIDACCNRLPGKATGLYAAEASRLTLDAGARQLAHFLDGYVDSCCGTDPRA